MWKKTTTELEEEIKKLIKVNQSNFAEHQKSEHELREIVRKKNKEIDVCRIVIEKKDEKIMILQEENSSLARQVDNLKLEEETDKAVIERLYDKIDEQMENKSIENEELKDRYEEKLKEAHIKFKNVETRVKFLDKNSVLKANLLQKIEELSNARKKEVEKLKDSIQNVGRSKVEKCRFGTKCRRWLCKYDHSHFFVKDNRVKSNDREHKVNTVAEINIHRRQKHDSTFHCSHCAEEFRSKLNLRKHVRSSHKEMTLDTETGRQEIMQNEDAKTSDDETDVDSIETCSSSTETSCMESEDINEENNSETESGEDSSF